MEPENRIPDPARPASPVSSPTLSRSDPAPDTVAASMGERIRRLWADQASKTGAPALPDASFPIDAALILGSGYSWFTDLLRDSVALPYSEIEGMPASTVSGHSGQLVAGTLPLAELPGAESETSRPRRLLVFSGRFHHYEGHPYSATTLPVRLAHALGARRLVLTNAAGGIRDEFHVGDLMLIDAFIRPSHRLHEHSAPAADISHSFEIHSSSSRSPGSERSEPSEGSAPPRTAASPFPWRAHPGQDDRHRLLTEARRQGIPAHSGTYLYVKGPSYETPAEIRAFRTLGADAVGMSTVPELIEAARLGLSATAFSLITNPAAGISLTKLDHHDISAVGERARRHVEAFIRLLLGD